MPISTAREITKTMSLTRTQMNSAHQLQDVAHSGVRSAQSQATIEGNLAGYGPTLLIFFLEHLQCTMLDHLCPGY